MKESEQAKPAAYERSFEQKSTWYSPVSSIYYKARPPYPSKQIAQAVALAQLSSDSSMLEIGCGPGNATTAFAPLGLSMTCLDPNQQFCELAAANCANYPRVEVVNTTFEQWHPAAEQQPYDAVLSANAFHWLSPEVKYAKISEALKDSGHLVLLWNLTPEPEREVYERLEPVYKAHVPSLVRYEGKTVQADILERFSQEVEGSNYFEKPTTTTIESRAVYDIGSYVDLLSTLRKMETKTKKLLVKEIRERVEEPVELSFLSAIQIAMKV